MRPQLLVFPFMLFLFSCQTDSDPSTEFILIDRIILHQQGDTKDKKMGFSGFELPSGIPDDWTQPLNFKDGKVYFRVSLLEKPDSRPVFYQMGFQWEGGCDGHYFKEKLPGNQLICITEPGLYQAEQSLSTFWEPDCQRTDSIDWTRRVDRMLVVIGDDSLRQIDDRWEFGTDIVSLDSYFPLKVHFQAVLVAKGETFSGWSAYPITLPDQQLAFSRQEMYRAHDRTYMGFGIGDINGDGLPDLAVQEGGYGGPLAWFEQDSLSGMFVYHLVEEVNPSGTHFSSGDTEVADIDGDGDIDLLGFEHPGEWQFDYTGDTLPSTLYWYENLGGGTAFRKHRIGKVPDFVKDVEIRDFNRDGKQDLVTITYRNEHNLSVFRQDQKEDWAHVVDRSLEGLHEGMDCGDLDGDGDEDIAANGYWIENPGGDLTLDWEVRVVDSRWFTQIEEHWRRNATKTVCRDVDRDGRAEIFMAHSEKAGYPIVWYDSENPRSDGWEMHLIAKGMTAVHTLQLGDLDGDGDWDLLAGENGDHFVETDNDLREVRIYFNRGSNKFWEGYSLKNGGLYNGNLFDMDKDGRLDICGPAGHEGDPYYVWFNGLE